MAFHGLAADSVMHLDLERAGLPEGTRSLIRAEHEEFEAVLGCPLITSPPQGNAPRWTVEPRPQDSSGPALEWSPKQQTLVSFASDPDEFLQTLNLLHTLGRIPGHRVEYRPAESPQAAADAIREEVLATFPSFGLRDIAPAAWAETAEPPEDWEGFGWWSQEWVAALGDAHTAVIRPSCTGFNPPYVGRMTAEGVLLEDVPERSPAYAAGVRAGWVIPIRRPDQWIRATGATAQHRDRVAARRALAVSGSSRVFTAAHPESGRATSWEEIRRQPELDDILDVAKEGTDIRVRLRAFDSRVPIDDTFDALCREATESHRMILDLRGNPGGSIALATSLRDRFLKERTRIGSVSFSDGRGGMSVHRDRWAEPSSQARWPGRLVILTDGMTYSAAEDFILGLQGLEHVTVLGSRTGGGSGRARTLPLGPDLILRVSTAVTYDRLGNPVEHRGILPEAPVCF